MKMKNLCDLHTHTTASGHAYNTLYEMARAGAEAGLSIFGSSDHAPAMPGTCSEMYFCNFSVIPRELFGVRLLMGCELNIIDFQGTVDLAPWLLERLDYGIASIRSLLSHRNHRGEHRRCHRGHEKSFRADHRPP